MIPEFERLAKQRCAYCSGWGHSGNDCPTDAKLTHLKGGVSSQSKLINELRKVTRVKAGMGDKRGFSTLSAKANTLGKRKRGNRDLDLGPKSGSGGQKSQKFN